MTDHQNAAVLNLEDAIAQVTEWLAGLYLSISEDDQKALNKIIHTWEKVVDELRGDGLTMNTCVKGAALMVAAENNAKARVLDGGNAQDLNMFYGLKGIHVIMGMISKQQGINEGGKDCCPYCGNC